MKSKPNVVVFLAEDLGFGDLACYGHRSHRSPHIDRLAASGVRFTDFHSNGCMCSPSRAALLTGLYQQRVGVEFVLNHHTRDQPAMRPDAYTFGHAFQRAGYATGFFGCYHTGYLPDNSPLQLGFDEFRGVGGGMDHHSHLTRWGKPNWWHGTDLVDEPGYSTDLIADHAISFIERHRDQPFCLYVPDYLVHFPWQGPKDKADFLPGVNNNTPERKYGSRPDRGQAYGEMIEAMDRSIGRIAQCLEELGLAQDTLFIFAADHGGHHLVADNGPLAGAKGSLLEGGHRVPAFACWPGVIEPNQVCDQTLMLTDLFPTFVELCDLPGPSDTPLDGVSLWSLLHDGQPIDPRPLFWRHGADRAVRRGAWKLLIDQTGERLFNLADDVAETRDQSNARPDLVAELSAELATWEASLEPTGSATR